MNKTLPNSTLSALLDCSPDGILAVDQNGRIVMYNQRFAELWGIPKEILDSNNEDKILQFVRSQLERPDEFFAKTREFPSDRASIYHEEIRLKNGRLFERYSTPYSDISGYFNGHVWYFRNSRSSQDFFTDKLLELSGSIDMENIVFTDLFNRDYLQKIQNAFSDSTGVASIITFPDGTPITKPSNFCQLCLSIRKTKKGLENCMYSDASIGRWNPGGPIVQRCLSGGLWDAGASITVGGKHVANWLIGQVKNEETDENKMLQYAHEIGADEKEFLNNLRKITVMPRDRFQKIADFLFFIASELSTRAYQNILQAREITARMQIEAELNNYRQHLEELVNERTSALMVAKEEAERANRAKSAFLASMSHELRTPLNAVLGFSQLMKNDPDVSAKQKESLDIINHSGEHLLNLINNILDISKIESGRVEMETAQFDLYQILQHVKSLMYVRAYEKGLKFTQEQSEDLPRRIEADGGKLRQILINLIGNAIKYTKQGGIILRAMVVKKSPEQVLLRFEVEDTGPGISEKDKKLIFQPFVQLIGQGVVETGTGLGLAICKQYVDLMGGNIDVTSKEGNGSVFFFEIPVKELPLWEIDLAPERGRVIGLEKGQPRYRLLIAEDQLDNRILLHKTLEPLNFDIRDAVNGKEALEIFEQWHPDLIWMDIRMPVMDGLEATHLIKSTDIGAHTKIIALTAHALEEDRKIIMQAGCDEFIRKPFRYTEIFDALTKHLGLRFVYEEKPVVPSKEPVLELKPEQLAVLPSDLLTQLHQAAIELNTKRTMLLIEQIIKSDAPIGMALLKIAKNLDYDRLVRLLDKYANSARGTDD